MRGNAVRGMLWWAVAALVALLALAAACGGSGPDGEPSPAPEASPSLTPTTAASPETAVATPTETAEVCRPDVTDPQPAPSGGDPSGRIMFVRLDNNDREIWVMNADGSDETNVTNSPDTPDDESDWSPDGKQIVFFSSERDETGGVFLYVMDADGSNVRRLIEGPGGDVSPKWSPDGKCIAFSRSGMLAVANADGSNVQTVMPSQPASEAEPCTAGSFVGGWSPDGQRLTYYSAILHPGGENDFWVCAMDYDGSNIEVLVEEPLDALHAEPAWSPDGKYITFRDDRDGNYDVYLLNLETGEETNVSNHPGADIEPAWSPDGEWLVFASMRDGSPNFDIYIMRRDGSDLQRLSTHPAKDSYPAWTR